MNAKSWAMLSALLLTGIAISANSATIRVPADQPTIQAGIDASTTGDTVLVAPGEYVEEIDFNGKAVTVASELGPQHTVLRGKTNHVVRIASGEGRDSVLRGFTLRAAPEAGECVIGIGGAAATVVNNVIDMTESMIVCGVAIGWASPLIQSNVITRAAAVRYRTVDGALGVTITGYSEALILDNEISNNRGGIELWLSGLPLIGRNIIKDNDGNGIRTYGSSSALIVGNLIVSNKNEGLHFQPSIGGGPYVFNNTIADNLNYQVSANGYPNEAQMINNNIIGQSGQPAIICGSDGTPEFMHNNVLNPGGPSYSESCGNPTGSNGNISIDPRFVNRAAGDYRLRSDSPCIDAGDNTVSVLPTTDLNGQSRVADGNDDGIAVVDMGAFEAQVVPPCSTLEDLLAGIQDLGLTGYRVQRLIAKVEAARSSLARGDREAAANQLGSFIHQIRAHKRVGLIDLSVANALITCARHLRDEINPTTTAALQP